jgi:pilus assembly protein CpaB
MKAARLIVLGIALAAGGVAAMLARGGRQPEPPPAPAPPPLATVDVLVAKADLGIGQVVGGQDVGWQTWPAASAGSNFIKKTDRPDAIKDFVGAIVRTPVAAGEPIRDSKVVIAKPGGFMAAILPHGMRAISLDVAPDTGAGGFILPNDHVDVVLTRRDKAAEKVTGVEKYVSETILRNVRVLAVDQTIEEKDGQKVVVGKTATIELDPHQAETLALGRQLGTLSLTLRSLLDSQSPTPEGGEAKEESKTPVNTVRYGVSTQSMAR